MSPCSVNWDRSPSCFSNEVQPENIRPASSPGTTVPGELFGLTPPFTTRANLRCRDDSAYIPPELMNWRTASGYETGVYLSGTALPVTIRVRKRSECQPVKDACGYKHCIHECGLHTCWDRGPSKRTVAYTSRVQQQRRLCHRLTDGVTICRALCRRPMAKGDGCSFFVNRSPPMTGIQAKWYIPIIRERKLGHSCRSGEQLYLKPSARKPHLNSRKDLL